MKRHPAFLVVAGWGLFNGLLLAVLAVYGESGTVYWLWGGVVLLLELGALLVLLSSCTEPEQHLRYRVPRGGAAALPAAVALTVGLLSLAYGLWLLSLAVPLLAVAAALALWNTSAPGSD